MPLKWQLSSSRGFQASCWNKIVLKALRYENIKFDINKNTLIFVLDRVSRRRICPQGRSGYDGRDVNFHHLPPPTLAEVTTCEIYPGAKVAM